MVLLEWGVVYGFLGGGVVPLWCRVRGGGGWCVAGKGDVGAGTGGGELPDKAWAPATSICVSTDYQGMLPLHSEASIHTRFQTL